MSEVPGMTWVAGSRPAQVLQELRKGDTVRVTAPSGCETTYEVESVMYDTEHNMQITLALKG